MKKFKPAVEELEQRLVCYALSGTAWADPVITVSYMPDETPTPFGASHLFRHLRFIDGGPARWQGEVQRAFSTWEAAAGVHFAFVADDGTPEGAAGAEQGDPRFGDIRIGCAPVGALGVAFYPGQGAGTQPGDIFLGSEFREYAANKDYNLFSVLLHEIGHSIGLAHSVDGTVMWISYTGTKTGLTPDDVAGAQVIYGPPAQPAHSATPLPTASVDLVLASMLLDKEKR